MSPDDKPPPKSDMNAEIAEVMASVLSLFGPVLEAVDGYRRQCVERGFTPEDASVMAAELHHSTMAMIRNSMNAVDA